MGSQANHQIGGVEDRLIWDLREGTVLRAKQDLHMEDSLGERVFTDGRDYAVVSMHPIADPPFVQLRNDNGDLHSMYFEHIRKWFVRIRPTRPL